MSTLPEQFSAATKANLDAQLAVLSTFTNKAIEGVEKVVELNSAVAKTSFEELNTAIKQAKDPQDFFSLTAAQAQQNTDKALEYTRLLASIFSGVQAELTKTTEAQLAVTNRQVVALVEEVTKHAPAGTEPAIALWKSAIGNANASYEQINKSTKQAAEAFEANLKTAANQISQATTKTRASKK